MRLALAADAHTARKDAAEDTLGRVEKLLNTYRDRYLSVPQADEESSDSRNEAHEFMSQTIGLRIANSINSLGQDKRASVVERLRRINQEA